MIAALYIRVSTVEQSMTGFSLEAQENLLRKYATDHGMTVFDLYADRGKSANKELSKRTELLRMVDDAEKKRFDVILFKDITRWSRNSAQYYKIQDRLDKSGVYWIAVEQPYLETKTPTGRFQVSVMLGTSQLESENTSQRIRFIQDLQAAKGGVLSGKVPLGYKIAEVDGMKRLVIDEDKRQMMMDAFSYLERYRNKAATIKYINRKYGYNFWQSEFTRIVRNPLYKGEYRGNKGYCEPYLTESEWNSLQSPIRISTPKKLNANLLFRGLIVCPGCGHVMTGHEYKIGLLSYRCSYHACYQRCDYGHTVNQAKLERFLLEQMSDILDRTELTDAAADLLGPEDTSEDRKKQIKDLNRKLSNLKELFIDGDIEKSSYTVRRDALKAEISRLESKQDNSRPNIASLVKTPWRELYDAKEPIEKAEWWRFVLQRIEITENGFVPIYK